MQAFLAAQYEKISTQIKEMERNIRRDLGLPERIISNSRKRKAGDDNHVQTSSPESSGLKPRPNQSGKRRKTVASASVVKTHSYSLRAGGGDRTAAVERPGVEKKVSAKGRAAATLDRLPRQVPCTPTKNPPDHALTPPTCRNLIDQQPQRPSTALILYRDPLCVQPQSYRLSSVMARRAAPQWHGRKQTRTVIGLSEVCVHAIPNGELNSTPKPRKVIVLDTTNLSLLDAAPPDLSVEAQHRNEESVKERTIEPLEDPTHKEAVTPTDVDYSQQEENMHERDLDPLGPGTEENIASPVSGENIQKSGSLIVDVTSDTGAPVDADERYDSCAPVDADERYDSCKEDQLSEPEDNVK
ncbi:hypothetical protein Bca52824_017703 [Brassica carinata]|uniref:Uncharacterized protein n=1 Tax=Brassica carinata TaxID=52824 RepID=A0A8X7VNE4_BRACI|nr:hypothetical protein Bca52824_017703 [Brassica carinata]